jgi:SAM-dependent methyltransferase
VDVGAGYCEFINHISARRRIAVDANPDLKQFAAEAVEVHCTNAEQMSFLGDDTVDVVFSSNFFEHLRTKRALHQLVLELHRILKPTGRLMIMGPNVRYLPGKYWDYYDHHLPLTEKSIEELLQISGFEVEKSLPRFIPYTTKSWLPKWPFLVRLYLALHVVSFPLFGKQFFVVARKWQGNRESH